MESWFVIALLSLALLMTVMRLVHQVRVVRALKRLLHRVLTLWRKPNASPLSAPLDDFADDDHRLRQ